MRQMSQGKPEKSTFKTSDMSLNNRLRHTQWWAVLQKGLGKTCQGKDMDGGISPWCSGGFKHSWETSRRGLSAKSLWDESIQSIPSQMNPKCQEL